ncbi:hypothetical protein RN607_00680 [Demequina capsici]|uniref:Uncharacterized protein n=1 Tax=Demequina capsici TaxID=3075620 RepID=A0AA96FCX2_9MICO|nr:hypothetical protein [Demequina sp. PMTSA13]WNM27548.1 hypothetical protein RN607_00680 [Demequina sp. PMTSA13]
MASSTTQGMVIANGVRYRLKDARRLGIPLDGKVVTKRSRQVTTSATGAVERPKGNDSTEKWVAFALAHGKTEDELKGLGRNDIKEMFPAPEDEKADAANVPAATTDANTAPDSTDGAAGEPSDDTSDDDEDSDDEDSDDDE